MTIEEKPRLMKSHRLMCRVVSSSQEAEQNG